jgi:hypothetical protein
MPATQAQPAQETNGHKRPGPPLGSRNAIRHGLRGAGLPSGCRKIETALNQFRRTLEDAVLEHRGEVSLVDAASVNSAYRWERHAQLAQRWLRLKGDTMNHTERLNYSREVARASSERDKAIAALCLPKRYDPGSFDWSTLGKGANGNG